MHRWILWLFLIGPMMAPAQEGFRHPSAKRPSHGDPLMTPSALREFFRPTVMLRLGTHRGSGTIVASRRGSTSILTAAHVVAGSGVLEAEFQPYNYGLTQGGRGRDDPNWPRVVPAEIVACDESADVALVRVRLQEALPYVAKLDLTATEPAPNEILTSIGIVSGTDLTGWRTDIKGQARIDLNAFAKRGRPGDARLFTVTTKAPEFGRSGGGLFRPDGAIVGVAVGRLSIDKRPEVGVFASMDSIRRLVRENHLEKALTPPVSRRTTSRPMEPSRTPGVKVN